MGALSLRPYLWNLSLNIFLGYEIEISDEGLFADPDYLGGIVFSENLIQVNASVEANEGRYNFTIAHELGHHVLHREIYLGASSDNASNILCRDTFEKPLIEVRGRSLCGSATCARG